MSHVVRVSKWIKEKEEMKEKIGLFSTGPYERMTDLYGKPIPAIKSQH